MIFAALDAISKLTAGWLENPGAPSPPVDDLLERIRAVRAPRAGAPGRRGAAGAGCGAGTGAAPAPAPASPAAADAGRAAAAPPPPRPAPPRPLRRRSPRPPRPTPGVRQIEETIRVTTQKLDDLMNQIGEILVTRIKFDERLAEIRVIERQIEQFQLAWAGDPAARGPGRRTPGSSGRSASASRASRTTSGTWPRASTRTRCA